MEKSSSRARQWRKRTKKWLKVTRWILIGIIVLFAALTVLTWFVGRKLVTHPMGERPPIVESPADYGLPYEEVTVTTADGLKLVGWYVPSQNGATIIAQHGYKHDRQDLLLEAQFLHKHGYGVLLTSFRAHDLSDGELITLGKYELQDFEAWYRYLLTRGDIDPDKIGLMGESMGGALGIKYAAENKNIRAVIAHSAFASMDGVISKGIQRFTGLPPSPFAPVITFWAEREADITASDIDATEWIQGMCDTPVFILQGGEDEVIPEDSGQRLYEAACGQKTFWYEPHVSHTGFDEDVPLELYETRVIAFYDRYLLGETSLTDTAKLQGR